MLRLRYTRRNRPNMHGESDDEAQSDGQDSTFETERTFHPLGSLVRRQLRILHSGDRIATRSNLTAGGDAMGLILGYRQYNGAPFCTSHSRVNEEIGVKGRKTVDETPANTQSSFKCRKATMKTSRQLKPSLDRQCWPLGSLLIIDTEECCGNING